MRKFRKRPAPQPGGFYRDAFGFMWHLPEKKPQASRRRFLLPRVVK